ncbi:MAG: hypothetical protein ACI4I5_05200 [Acutalibacteraceae bacterium]
MADKKNKTTKNTSVRKASKEKSASAGAAKENAVVKKIIAYGGTHKKAVLLAVCSAVLVFAICLSVVSGYNEFLLQKVGTGYAAVLQRESVYPIGIDADEEVQRIRETNRHGQKTAFRYFCEEEIIFRNCTSFGALILANPESNDCDLVATIFDKDGRILYRSDGIEPGKYLSQIRLMQGLQAGEYSCRLYVTGFDRETQKAVGVQYTKLKIIVEENTDG